MLKEGSHVWRICALNSQTPQPSRARSKSALECGSGPISYRLFDVRSHLSELICFYIILSDNSPSSQAEWLFKPLALYHFVFHHALLDLSRISFPSSAMLPTRNSNPEKWLLNPTDWCEIDFVPSTLWNVKSAWYRKILIQKWPPNAKGWLNLWKMDSWSEPTSMAFSHESFSWWQPLVPWSFEIGPHIFAYFRRLCL